MAPLVCLINELHPSITTSAIKVRVVRAYEVPFNGNAADTMSFECILHDHEGVKIHASFGRSLLKTVAARITEGHFYVMHKFYIRPNHMRFKTTDNEYRIIMTQKSQICEIEVNDFPSHMFSFKTFVEIAGIENVADTSLFVIIGVIVESGGIVNQPNAKMLELKIEDENHNSVICTLWEDYVDQFLSQVDPNVKQIPIVVIQFCRPHIYKGEVRISTSYNVSKITLNKDTKEINDLRKRIFGNIRFMETINLTFNNEPKRMIDETKNLDVKSIEDVFCLEDGCYWICGKIDHIECNGEWWYMACKRCAKKVTKVDHRFFCDRCNKYEGVASKRFMLRINVVDASSNATLLLWDRECVQLLGKRAWEIDVAAAKGGDSCNIPKQIEEKLLERFILFKVQLRNDSDFRFDQPYTVNKICITPHIVDQHSAKIIESQNESSARSLSDISFGYDVGKENSEFEPMTTFGEEFEAILKEGDNIIESGKRELD